MKSKLEQSFDAIVGQPLPGLAAAAEPPQPEEPTVQQCADYLRELARAARIAAARGLGNESNEVRAQAYECAADGLMSLVAQQVLSVVQPVAPTIGAQGGK